VPDRDRSAVRIEARIREVDAEEFQAAEHLAAVFSEVCRVGDFRSDLLCAEFSGRNLFGMRMTSTLVH
jgi:hypothetical protein